MPSAFHAGTGPFNMEGVFDVLVGLDQFRYGPDEAFRNQMIERLSPGISTDQRVHRAFVWLHIGKYRIHSNVPAVPGAIELFNVPGGDQAGTVDKYSNLLSWKYVIKQGLTATFQFYDDNVDNIEMWGQLFQLSFDAAAQRGPDGEQEGRNLVVNIDDVDERTRRCYFQFGWYNGETSRIHAMTLTGIQFNFTNSGLYTTVDMVVSEALQINNFAKENIDSQTLAELIEYIAEKYFNAKDKVVYVPEKLRDDLNSIDIERDWSIKGSIIRAINEFSALHLDKKGRAIRIIYSAAVEEGSSFAVSGQGHPPKETSIIVSTIYENPFDTDVFNTSTAWLFNSYDNAIIYGGTAPFFSVAAQGLEVSLDKANSLATAFTYATARDERNTTSDDSAPQLLTSPADLLGEELGDSNKNPRRREHDKHGGAGPSANPGLSHDGMKGQSNIDDATAWKKNYNSRARFFSNYAPVVVVDIKLLGQPRLDNAMTTLGKFFVLKVVKPFRVEGDYDKLRWVAGDGQSYSFTPTISGVYFCRAVEHSIEGGSFITRIEAVKIIPHPTDQTDDPSRGGYDPNAVILQD